MRRLFLSLVGPLTLALLAACAGLEDPVVDPDPKPQTKLISMGVIIQSQRTNPAAMRGAGLGSSQ